MLSPERLAALARQTGYREELPILSPMSRQQVLNASLTRFAQPWYILRVAISLKSCLPERPL